MSATLVSSNTTIKVNAAVAGSGSSSSGTLYTAPANGYAIIHWGTTSYSSGTYTISIDGLQIGSLTTSQLLQPAGGFYVGPGKSVTYTNSGSVTIVVKGVEFINTP